MLIPLNLSSVSSIALSVCRTDNGYSVTPCTVINGYGSIELPSYYANKQSETDMFGLAIDPVVTFEFDDIIASGPNLYECIEKCLKELEERYNQL